MKCIYCNEEKNINELSLEHIFPSALGGKSIKSELFKTRNVCKRCNNLSGLYIDSIFVKNFFATSLVLFSKYIGYYNFKESPHIPFSYFGFVEYIKHPKFKYCEKWLWLDGSRIYHFHNNSDKSFKTVAGGDPRKRKNNDAGETYLVGVTNNSFWINLLINAYTRQFKKSKNFFVNYKFPDNQFFSINDIQKSICEKINQINQINKNLEHTLVVQADFNIRFQAKLALGLGNSLFGKKYAQSQEAKHLRDIFWNKDYKKLEKLKPEMMNFFSKEKNNLMKISKFIGFPGTHGLFFLIIDNYLIFYADLYGEQQYPVLTVITKNINNYNHKLIKQYPKGWGYILAPQRDIFIGEFDILHMLAYNTGDKSYLPELVELEKLYKSRDELPPFNKNEI